MLKCDERFFALTFGYGRAARSVKIVRQFGLKTVLNTIDPAQIRSLDTKTFEDMVVARNMQASRSTTVSTFEVDAVRDILRAATGEPGTTHSAPRLRRRLGVLNIDTVVGDLTTVCRDLFVAYSADSYKDSFGWVDDLAQVVDAATIAQLDGQLVAELKTSDSGSTHLAMPEVLDWQEIDKFRIAGTRATEYDDLDLDAYLAELPRLEDLTLQKLKSRRVQVKFARSSEWDTRWTLYQCLVSEQRTEDGLFALIEGRWFKISDSLAERVDEYTSGLSGSSIAFPSAHIGESEEDYNRRLAGADTEHRLCLDARLVRAEGATSRIEVCDVLIDDRTLVHVKRKSRSSTLSHLFSQGVVSMTTLLHDATFRGRVRELISEQVSGQTGWDDVIPAPSTALDRDAFTVSYVVLVNSRRQGTDWLPFFSKLNLMHAVRSLRANQGVNVTIDRVDVIAPSRTTAADEQSG